MAEESNLKHFRHRNKYENMIDFIRGRVNGTVSGSDNQTPFLTDHPAFGESFSSIGVAPMTMNVQQWEDLQLL